MGEQTVNRAKPCQLALFPLNNGATNVYFVLVLSYVLNFGSGVLGMGAVFVSIMITGMRVCDAVTDPIIGALIDKTNGRFGKFRPFMVAGNLIMAVSVFLMYVLLPQAGPSMAGLRYLGFTALYFLWVIGYTFGSLAGMGAMQVLAPIVGRLQGGYNTPGFFAALAPIGIVVSMVLTALAVVGIWEKDRAEYFGVGGPQERLRLSEYVQILRANKPMQRLMAAGAGCKLALAIATHTAVLCMLYGSMMGDYDGLYLPMMIIGYASSAPFFLLTIRTSQKKGQKASLVRYVTAALVCYGAVLALLLLWRQGDPAWNLSILSGGGLSLNLYTLLFILFFGAGYGAYYSTADMPIPMVADCSDYETYRSGRYIPGVMGTLFSLVDKLVSSLASLVVTAAVSVLGLSAIPDQYTPYVPGMNRVVIVLFCLIPMAAWAAALIAMRGYTLTGQRMKTIQAVNAARKEAVARGMTLEEAMTVITDGTVERP